MTFGAHRRTPGHVISTCSMSKYNKVKHKLSHLRVNVSQVTPSLKPALSPSCIDHHRRVTALRTIGRDWREMLRSTVK